VSTTTTDSNGAYSFKVATGHYRVEETNKAAYTDVADKDGTSTNTVNQVDVQITPKGTDKTGNNFLDKTNSADLALTKSVSNATPTVGQDVVFRLKIVNNGPNDAVNVKLTDTLPAGLKYVSDDSGGGYSTSTGIWSIGNLANGASKTLQITARPSQAASINNTANVTTDTNDPNTANNSDNVQLRSKTATPPPAPTPAPAPAPSPTPPSPPPAAGAFTAPPPAPPAAPVLSSVVQPNIEISVQDRVISQGTNAFALPAGAIQLTGDPDNIQVEATLADGSPLPDFVKFDADTQTFTIDADAAIEAGLDALDIRVTASDNDNNEASAVFSVAIADGQGDAEGEGLEEGEGVEGQDDVPQEGQGGENQSGESPNGQGGEGVPTEGAGASGEGAPAGEGDQAQGGTSPQAQNTPNTVADMGRPSLADQVRMASTQGFKQQSDSLVDDLVEWLRDIA